MDFRHTVEKLRRRIDEVGRHIYGQRAPMTSWQYHVGAQFDGGSPPDDEVQWQAVRSFDGLEAPFWLRARVQTPQTFHGKPVALFLQLGGHQHALFGTEALVYVDGRLVQGVDAFHQEVLLANKARGGQEYAVTLHLFWCPELGSVGVMPHRRLEIRSESTVTELVQIDRDTERFYWDANTAHELAVTLDENDITRVNILNVLDEAFNLVDFREPLGEEFLESLATADELVRTELYRGPGTGLAPRALAVGQTHIDVAWLWPIPVTHEKIGRTFATMLRMMEQYPDYYFFQNQPQVYEYCKRYFPQLYEEVRARISEGRWEANGGMWLEPDCNVPSGESLVRQLVFGQRYFQEEFGVRSDVRCLMDVFGLPWCLPQLMQGTGMKYFLTTKLSWSQYNRIPYDSFRWRGGRRHRGAGALCHCQKLGDPHDVQRHTQPRGIERRMGQLSAEGHQQRGPVYFRVR